MKKKLLVYLVFVLLLMPLLATTFTIRDYVISIDGKTQEWAVRNLIVPSETESFSSMEELTASLNNKKQILDNKRVFKSVEYTISAVEEVGDITYVDIAFSLIDAKTFLLIPYPKYDSNYGARIGLKYYNRNLMGTFSDLNGTVHGTFTPWDFDTLKYYAEFDLTDFYIARTKIKATFKGNATQLGGVSDYSLSSTITDINLGKIKLDMTLGFEKGSDTKYTLSSTLKGITKGSVSFTPSLSFTTYEKARTSDSFTFSLSTNGISLAKTNISFTDSIKFSTKSKEDGGYNTVPTELNHSSSFKFTSEKLSKYSYSHTLTYKVGETFAFNNTLSYNLSDVTTLYLHENLQWNKDWFLSFFDTGVGISQKIKIGEHISIEPKLQEFLTTSFKPNDDTVYFSRYYLLSASTSGDYINWKGNFRDGIKYSISISEGWNQNYGSRSNHGNIIDHGEISIHKTIGSWFNPSMRVIVNYTTNVNGKGSIGASDSGDLGEYLRGVRNATINKDGRDKNIFVAVANINFMSVFPLPKFVTFADAYINFFVDYAFTKHGETISEGDIAKHYLGFGIEGIGIFKEYPSYPIRASLGFDARKLKAYAEGSGDKGFYEIYIGLDFFF